MMYSKIKMTLTLVITTITLFIVSCEQIAIDNPDINETANLSTHDALVAAVATDQSHKDILNYMYGELNDQGERTSVYGEYVDNVLFTNHPELAKMEREEALDVVSQAVSQMDLIEMRNCHCNSGCHWCCIMQGLGGSDNCFSFYCLGYGWCRWI